MIYYSTTYAFYKTKDEERRYALWAYATRALAMRRCRIRLARRAIGFANTPVVSTGQGNTEKQAPSSANVELARHTIAT